MTKPELLERLDSNMHRIRVLLANGNRDLKMELKISNQDYPRWKELAIDHLMTQSVYVVAVQNVLDKPSTLYAKDIRAEINAETERLLEVLRGPGEEDES